MTVVDIRKRPVNEKAAFVSGLKHARDLVKEASRTLSNEDAFDILESLQYKLEMAIEMANAVDA